MQTAANAMCTCGVHKIQRLKAPLWVRCAELVRVWTCGDMLPLSGRREKAASRLPLRATSVRRRRTKSRRVKRRVGIRCGPGMESQRTSATRRRRQRRFPTCRSILGSFDPAVSGSSIFRSCGSLDVARQVAVHVERRGVGWSQVIICTFYMLEREARPSPFRGPRLADRRCR